jgi:two-component system response regulator AtoC
LKTILVVDDNPDTLECFEEILSSAGYTVIARRDGRSALIFVHENNTVDLIITDYRMPGMNGLELVAELKSRTPQIPVIMCSVHMRADVYSKALDLGVAEYMQKPVGVDDLRQVVATVLDGAAKQSAQSGVTD